MKNNKIASSAFYFWLLFNLIGCSATQTSSDETTSTSQKIGMRIKSNIMFNVPPDLISNDSVEYEITLSPNGSVLHVKKLKSSGLSKFDEAVQEAIVNSQPYHSYDKAELPISMILISRPKELPTVTAEYADYMNGLTYFRTTQYEKAAQSFADFIQRYPQSLNIPLAQYWMGNSYFAQRKYENAIAAHNIVVKNYSDTKIAPDALLNISSSYIEMNDRVSAKNILKMLIEKYPLSKAAEIGRERLQTLQDRG